MTLNGIKQKIVTNCGLVWLVGFPKSRTIGGLRVCFHLLHKPNAQRGSGEPHGGAGLESHTTANKFMLDLRLLHFQKEKRKRIPGEKA